MTSLLRKTSVMKTANLQSRLLDLIGRGVERSPNRDAARGKLPRHLGSHDAEFNALALEVFEYQFARNKIYRGWCEMQKVTPQSVRHWREIPAVPTSAFKDFALTCFPVEKAVAEFHTSGTTRGKSGKHFFKTLELYDAAIVPNFEAHLLPEIGTARRAVRSESELQLASDPKKRSKPKFELQTSARWAIAPSLFILTPSPKEAPHSSLSHMMGVVAERMNDELGGMKEEDYFFVRDARLESERLATALRSTEESGVAALLLGTAFAFVHFFDFCARKNLRFELPAESRAMETGGFKGKSREMTKNELYGLFEKYLGIPSARVVNEYGMTELSTQFYDLTLRGKSAIENRKSVPPWARVMIIDPRTRREAREGEHGLIRIFDLANLYSVMAIQTEDWGVMRGEGFEVLGRAMGAEARGCSIAADEFGQG
jgi:hypothetical protein